MKDTLFDEKIAGSFQFTPGSSSDDCFNGNKSALPVYDLPEGKFDLKSYWTKLYFHTDTTLVRSSVIEKLPTDYFDDGLSCFMGSASDPKGIMLVHKKLSGIYRVDYMSYEEEVPERADMLTAHFLMQAMELEGEPVVWIPYDKRVSEFTYRVCPTQLGTYLISGVLV